jgi:hypothetical protein
MPKSKRGRHLSRSKRKGRKTFTAPATQAPVTAGAVGPTSVAEKPAPKPKAPVMVAEASNAAAELRRIGIVAGAIIVILVILALILA